MGYNKPKKANKKTKIIFHCRRLHNKVHDVPRKKRDDSDYNEVLSFCVF